MNTAELISKFGEKVILTQFGSGQYVNGRYVNGSSTISSITMSVQPLTDKELLNQPEGQRTKRIVKGYTPELLKTSDERTSVKADLIEYDNTLFEVQKVEQWRRNGEFYKVTLAEINP